MILGYKISVTAETPVHTSDHFLISPPTVQKLWGGVRARVHTCRRCGLGVGDSSGELEEDMGTGMYLLGGSWGAFASGWKENRLQCY